MHYIQLEISWVDDNGCKHYEEAYTLANTRSIEGTEAGETLARNCANAHAELRDYSVSEQEYSWWTNAVKPRSMVFLGLNENRLRELARAIPNPAFSIGDIVFINPEEGDPYPFETPGLVIETSCYNDGLETEEGSPVYFVYKIQVIDEPPIEDNEFFEGFSYDEDCCVFVSEEQIAK